MSASRKRKVAYIEEKLYLELLIQLHQNRLKRPDDPESFSEWVRRQAQAEVDKGKPKTKT